MRYQVSVAAGLLAAMLLTGCAGGQGGVGTADQFQSSVPAAQSVLQEEPEVVSIGVEVTKTADELIALSENADWAWFDDVVMIGDSVSLKLKNFVVKQRQTVSGYFGEGQFLASGSLGSGNALWDAEDKKAVHPTYQGEKMKLEQSIPLTGAKKIYMMLGVNDIAVYGLEGAVENYKILLDSIQAEVPDAQFYIQSATPICEGAEVGALNNENLVLYNDMLLAMCEERGIPFVDVASVLRDELGYLPRDYCSDPNGMGIHLQDTACQLWLGYLLEDAQLRK